MWLDVSDHGWLINLDAVESIYLEGRGEDAQNGYLLKLGEMRNFVISGEDAKNRARLCIEEVRKALAKGGTYCDIRQWLDKR